MEHKIKPLIKSVKRYKYDINQSAITRWTTIFNDNKDKIPLIKKTAEAMLDQYGLSGYNYWFIKKIISSVRERLFYSSEIEAISSILKLDFEQVVLLQILYEMSTACTSIITRIDDNIVFFRTMDWDFPILKEITIELEFIKNNELLFIATTWLGCVGFYTVFKPKYYSVALNFRATGPITTSAIINNLWKLYKLKWPASYLIRHCCEKNNTNIKAISGALRYSSLVAPCYFTVCSYDPSIESAIITRSCSETINYRIDNLYQTNCDYKEMTNPKYNILYSRERCYAIKSILEKNNNNFKSIDHLLMELQQFPIVNDETIYLCVMNRNRLVTLV